MMTDLSPLSQLALSVAMGREVDSVIVDTEKVGLECINYLKDQRLPPMTFIPLATCKVREIDRGTRRDLSCHIYLRTRSYFYSRKSCL